MISVAGTFPLKSAWTASSALARTLLWAAIGSVLEAVCCSDLSRRDVCWQSPDSSERRPAMPKSPTANMMAAVVRASDHHVSDCLACWIGSFLRVPATAVSDLRCQVPPVNVRVPQKAVRDRTSCSSCKGFLPHQPPQPAML